MPPWLGNLGGGEGLTGGDKGPSCVQEQLRKCQAYSDRAGHMGEGDNEEWRGLWQRRPHVL